MMCAITDKEVEQIFVGHKGRDHSKETGAVAYLLGYDCWNKGCMWYSEDLTYRMPKGAMIQVRALCLWFSCLSKIVSNHSF